MALLANGILFPFTGKLGNVIGFRRNGKYFLRPVPAKSTKEPSIAQLARRARFALTHEILRPIYSLVSDTFKHSNRYRMGHNLAFSYTIGNVIKGTYPDYTIDWSKLLISQGYLFPAEKPEAIAGPGKITFQWNCNPANTAHKMDLAILAVYAPALNQCIYTIGSAERKCCASEINVKAFAGQTVHTYIGFLSPDKKKASKSLYTGSFYITI